MRDVVIVGAARTAVGLENKSLKDVPPETLGAIVMKEAVSRSGLKDPAMIEEVFFGHCLGGSGNLARFSALEAGLPQEIPAVSIDRQCGSGSTASI